MSSSQDFSWSALFDGIPQKYDTPADVPGGVPLVPGHTELQKDWASWGKAWREYYDSTTVEAKAADPSGKPSLPLPGATDQEWVAYGRAIGVWAKKQAAETQEAQ